MHDNDLDEFAPDHGGVEASPSPLKSKKVQAEDTEEDKKKKKDLSTVQWASLGDDTYVATGKTVSKLKPGAYTYFVNHGNIFLKQQTLKTDELLEFPNSMSNTLIEEIEKFWDTRAIFHHYGFLHKRGYILYGAPGCGKTGIIQLLIQKVVERKGIVILVDNPDPLARLMEVIRAIEPNRHIVCIIEDVDALIRAHGDSDLLAFLDGENQIDDILTIATTNYPERLDRRIVSRPRRFDRRIKIMPPTDEMRRAYFLQKLKISEEEVEEWVTKSNKFTFAGMTDLVIQVKCLGIDIDTAVADIYKLTYGATPKSDEDNGKLGFGN